MFPFFGHVGKGSWKGAWVSEVRNAHPHYSRGITEKMHELNLDKGKIGIVSADKYWVEYGFPHSTYVGLVSDLKEAELVDVSNMVEAARQIKTPAELKCMEIASQIGAQVIESIRKNAKPSADHRAMKLGAITTMYERGAEIGNFFAYSFGDNITHAGVNMAFVDTPGTKPVKQNEVILTEFAVRYLGYEIQYNQPFVAGTPTKEWKRVFEACSEGYTLGYNTLRPGLTAGELEDIVLMPILKAGYTFSNPMFHGMGLSIEQPIGTIPAKPLHMLDRSFVFKENMTIELEPHGMTKDLKFGLSLGDTLAITDSGCRRMGKESKPEFISTT